MTGKGTLLRVPFKLGTIVVGAGYRMPDGLHIAVPTYDGRNCPGYDVYPLDVTQGEVVRKTERDWAWRGVLSDTPHPRRLLATRQTLKTWPLLELDKHESALVAAINGVDTAHGRVRIHDLWTDQYAWTLVWLDIPEIKGVPRSREGRACQNTFLPCDVFDRWYVKLLGQAINACWAADLEAHARGGAR
ncbi:hypothetical protein [Nanchangia anserum]|uniref:Uncharacterized protein n=2 Tax=Nanchangia anserum TaxID=2692125 RepID=A0A8I0G8H3_9ACTO|nr:hypothetical protein [Nanchangia anserum]MBD3689850.1 hypothetical protein [Nanchangia anserum]